MKRTCKQCGKEFELSESEISFYKSKGLELPKRCQSCRNQNKKDAGQTQRTDKERNSASLNTGTRGLSRSGGSSHNGGNNKSYIVVAIAAVLMLLAALGVKNFFLADSERLLVSEQEAVGGTQDGVLSHPSDEEQQSLAGGDDGREVEPTSQLPESADEENSPYILPQDEQPEVQTQQDAQTEITTQTISQTSDNTYKFRKAQYLTEHFQKHGEEFPYATEDEYLQGANNVINNPDALHKLEAEDGDDVYYVENTNEFVIVSTDGYIRTYFKASMDYYNRQ